MIKNSMFALATMFLFNQDIYAQEVKQREVFNAPVLIESPTLSYPSSEARKGVEGWVVINFMVNKEGEVFEPSIVGSTGSKKFENRAMRSIEEAQYKPANIDGQPVDGSATMRFMFSFKGGWGGARNKFVRAHKKFIKAIKNNDKEKARAFIDKYKDEGGLNNYERAYLNFNRANYAALYGTKIDEMRYLNSSLLFEGTYDDDSRFLPDELLLSVRRQLFAAQAANNYFEEAMRSYYLIKNKHGAEAVSDFKPAHDKILKIKSDDTAYAIPAKTSSNGLWSINLFKASFSIDSRGSVINELKLRCKKKYVFLAFKEGDQYAIPKSWGACSLQVLGAANSEFDLVQL